MSLKENLHTDIKKVFLNLTEFAEIHDYEGQELVCLVDDAEASADGHDQNGLRNVTGLGILAGDRVLRCQASDLAHIPLPGERVRMDGTLWIAGNGISIDGGLLTLPLNRAY